LEVRLNCCECGSHWTVLSCEWCGSLLVLCSRQEFCESVHALFARELRRILSLSCRNTATRSGKSGGQVIRTGCGTNTVPESADLFIDGLKRSDLVGACLCVQEVPLVDLLLFSLREVGV